MTDHKEPAIPSNNYNKKGFNDINSWLSKPMLKRNGKNENCEHIIIYRVLSLIFAIYSIKDILHCIYKYYNINFNTR